VSLKDTILGEQNTKLPVYPVTDTGWKDADGKPVTVYVRELSGLERSLMYSAYDRFKKMQGDDDNDEHHDAFVLAWTLMEDPAGRKRIFSDADVLSLQRTSSKVLSKLARFAGKVNGLGRYAEEVLPFRSEGEQGADDVAQGGGDAGVHGDRGSGPDDVT